eukprot:TRINITY_DN22964_c0_g1_i1.p1 TRINITY_DN22964_c0_g1~~TRINITY_DN22964_c0_g1_i1.p1  ORF type:complete len:504 (-),score=79.79 TRINITY_DN22964_c0_g1_i1:40-1551(-)
MFMVQACAQAQSSTAAMIVSRTPVQSNGRRLTPPPGSWGERYRTGAWTPNSEEVHAVDLEVIQGSIPKDISGRYIRNTENPIHDSMDGNRYYHPFDGDGMLHMLRIKDGKASYCNRWVRTKAFEEEQKAGRSLWAGVLEVPMSKMRSERPGWGEAIGKLLKLKDTASTDVVVHAGRVIPSWYLCGEAYTMNLETLETEGIAPWSPKEGVSAHCKVDESTGELLFFNYGFDNTGQWFFNYGEVDRNSSLTNYQYIPLAHRMAGTPHDMAFSKKYSILCYFGKNRSHFAVIPRHGTAAQVRWFEAGPTYVLHFLNAHEEGDELILDGYHMARPDIFRKLDCLDLHAVVPQLWRWRFNMKSGQTSEMCLDPRVLEFGVINPKYHGENYKYAYSVIPHKGEFMFTGITKNNLQSGESQTFEFGSDVYGSEAPVVPKIGGREEDDAYLISFLTDMKNDRSVAVIVDCKSIEAGPVCTILLPHRISSGTHAFWADDAATAVVTPPFSKL